jgi:hypothetical protein
VHGGEQDSAGDRNIFLKSFYPTASFPINSSISCPNSEKLSAVYFIFI